MTDFSRFFLPGPTAVHPDVLQAMARQPVGHRGEEISRILGGVDAPLRRIFNADRPVYVSSSSATGLMEGAVRNGVRRRALCLVNGAFSARFRDLLPDCGKEHESYEVEWGEAHDPEEVERRLRAGGFDAVTVVHSETSTGVLNPLPEIAAAVHAAARATGEEIFILMDGVSSVAGVPVDADGWGVDWMLTGSQKAMALPPGLAFATPSARLLERAATLEGRGQYFDALEFDRYWQKRQTPSTPAVNLVYALVEQLRRIDAEGLQARFDRHLEMARTCWAWAEGRGIPILAPEGHRSWTVTTLRASEGRTGLEVAAAMQERGWTIASGYGKMSRETYRIGHMGDHTVAELNELLRALEEVLQG